ncbi:MAG TPA: MarR family transcriptional regulator [Alphaproteobacteria bacterium]|nr:MarR family transcriptional regulator [Alphaproteobacteria bacterium]
MRQKKDTAKISADFIAQECLAVRLRLLTRAVTKLYNRALRPHGLTISQMNILVAVSHLGQVNQQRVCQALHLDKSTLSRDLARMRTQGWINAVPAADGRAALLRLTPAGRALLEQAFPAWQRAQEQARVLLGEMAAASLEPAVKAIRAKGLAPRS